MADVAVEMAQRGYRVRVVTSARGYDDPSKKYPKHETRDGVKIRRLPLSSFGKKSIAVRLLAQLLFVFQAMIHAILTRNLSVILVSTSPPMCSIAGVVAKVIRRVPVVFWVMDLNPDQMIELGLIGPKSIPARVFDFFNRAVLKRASDVIVLDRFMAKRVNAKHDSQDKMHIIAPWPHEGHLELVAHEDNPFRKTHDLDGKFVVMYSGNHAIANPITTILDAALLLQDNPKLVFMFIGGGVGKKEVEEVIATHQPSNIISLPYQPLSEIKYSLSAADVHLVSIGDSQVGIVHPCKVYGAMAVARPILMLGPKPCHVSDIIDQHDLGWAIEHGDVECAVDVLRVVCDLERSEWRQKSDHARKVVDEEFGAVPLTASFCDIIEKHLTG